MRNLFLTSLLFIVHTSFAQTNNQRLWDRQMKLKTGSIQITTDGFTATTFIELEFYNHHIAEIEGLFRFQLRPEQIITAFQLDLNGKYRDGSIEEKWKATNTYNRIVGKRIDPALLTKENDNNYHLRIYPVPAKGVRKVTITIQQALKIKGDFLDYYLPFVQSDTADKFSISIMAFNCAVAPQSVLGLIYNEIFAQENENWKLVKHYSELPLSKPIQFQIQQKTPAFFCSKKLGGKNYFALRYKPKVDSTYQLHPSTLHVYWDISATGLYRNTEKELSFLKQYITHHKIQQVTFTTFNHDMQEPVIFRSANMGWSRLTEYVRNLTYEGGTRFSKLNFSSSKSDVILLFSDGKSSIGSRLPIIGRNPVFTLNTSAVSDSATMMKIAGNSGGTYVPLHKISIEKAIETTSTATNYLIDILSSGKSIFESKLFTKLNEPILLYGTSTGMKDTITFLYGNNSYGSGTEQVVIDYSNSCVNSSIDRLNMLISYEQMMRHYNWNDILDFGLTEKVVTPYTAYIVLELVEHYIQYNITPPKELEQECIQRGFVKKDTRPLRNNLNMVSTDDLLLPVVNHYNERIKRWDKNEKLIEYKPTPVVSEQPVIANIESSVNKITQQLQGRSPGIYIGGSSASLQEVVVIGYGSTTKRSLTYSVSTLSSKEIQQFNGSIAQILAGRVPGLSISGTTGEAGSSANIRIRGSSSLSISSQPLYVIDGVPVNGSPDNILNPNDIENITVMRDAAGSTIYGSRGSNGVIIITTKKGKAYSNYYNHVYALKNMPDVDYLIEIKQTPSSEKLRTYYRLKEEYKNDAGFCLDMAEHLYNAGFKKEAISILMNTTELFQNKFSLLRAVGFILEGWHEYEKAEEIYTELVSEYPDNLSSYRNLAQVLMAQKKYQAATTLLNNALLLRVETDYYQIISSAKSIVLNEMNGIIESYKDSLELSNINPSLIKPLPCDLRIVAEENSGIQFRLKINEPGIGNWVESEVQSKHGGSIISSGSFNYGSLAEYTIKNAAPGKYKIHVSYYNGYMYAGKLPSVLRLTIYKNFGKPNQTVETKNIMMDNQFGEIEIAETSW